MFDRFIRLARARKALREQRFEDALQLALDPVIRADRRADEVRAAAAQQLLARARQRLEQGERAAAKLLAQRVHAAIGGGAAADVLAAIEAATVADQAVLHGARQAYGEARAAVEAGDLARAEAVLAAQTSMPAAERKQVENALAERRRQAGLAAEQGAQHFADGAWVQALQALARAQLLARDHAAVAALRRQLVADGAEACARCARARLAGDLAFAIGVWRATLASLPELREHPALRPVAAALRDAVMQALAASSSLAAAAAFAQQAHVAAADLELPPPATVLLEALLALHDASAGERAERAQALAAAAEAARVPALAALAREHESAAATDEQHVAAARACVEGGDLDGARAKLTAMLAARPLHEAARRELALLDQTFAELEQRLHDARAAMRAGRLRQVCAIAQGLGGNTRIGVEAQQLATQARARMALVDRGLDEVRVALHGRATATQEGLRHCGKRLEELAKVQCDHVDLPGVVDAVQAEIEALGVCERTAQALDRGALTDVLAGCSELLAIRARLLAPARLEAHLLDLADRLARFADVALAGGRLRDLDRCADQFDALQPVRAEFGARAAQWRAQAAERRAAAAKLVADARACLAERDLAEAERLADAARQQWLECDEAKLLTNELRLVREQADALDRVAGLARERDFEGAQQKLAAMPAASPYLRTRIYDMKQDLARAQGLEGAFLLRVDEGGEQLVLRGETVTIGNVRQNRADLPVLANLAGRHASIRRSMSFHGGMQDTIVAEEGEVRVGGAAVTSRPLAPGDRVQLGPALGFVYQRPTARSLTVGIVLQSGFQVAGTDRILLMKDRGRDGRILLGAGADVHVRVARATGEVEIFATNSGQMRVACAPGGTIDGVPFQGEHPLAAGQQIEAAGMSFRLLPWRPGT
jgi:hypothetical protein